MINIEFSFYIDSGTPFIKSNIESNGLDMLQVVSADLSNADKIKECIGCIKAERIWWFNASKIEYDDDFAVIKAAFDWEAEVRILRPDLINVLSNFLDFVNKMTKGARRK